MSQSVMGSCERPYAALVGIDWADQTHALALLDLESGSMESEMIKHTPEALHEWAERLQKRFAGRKVAIALEQSRGPLIYALMKYPHLAIYPLPPARLSAYRLSFSGSGAKDDPTDAGLILDYLRKHRDQLRSWQPDPQQTRCLMLLVEQRRHIVDQRTALVNQLIAQLKCTFPQALSGWLGEHVYSRMASDFLLKWPDLQALKQSASASIRRFFHAHNVRRPEVVEARLAAMGQAKPLVEDPAILEVGRMTVRALAGLLRKLVDVVAGFDRQISAVFAVHDEAALFASLPGAGAALAPRLCCALGSDRGRFADAGEVQTFVGIAPVTKRSGQSKLVQRRWACPTFLKQTFQEFAACSIRQCAWAKAFYQLQLSRGKKHHAAVRSLAFKWIRVIFACWQNRTPYDDARHVAQLKRTSSPLLQYMPQTVTQSVENLSGCATKKP